MRIKAVAIVALAVALISGGMAYAQAPNPQAQAEFERWVNQHPELQSNPGLINNPSYRASHPAFAGFLKTHPYVNREALQNYGAWGPDRQWHNRNWWMQNNPNWVQQNRPIWQQPRSEFGYGNGYGNGYGKGDGDYDEQHRWHKREWWMHHRREWAERNHPGWFQQGGPGRGPGEGPQGNAWGYGHGHGHGHGNDNN